MDANEQINSKYQDYIEQLLKQSEQPIAFEKKISLRYLGKSFNADIKKQPTIRLPVPRQNRIIKNNKITTLAEKNQEIKDKGELQGKDDMNVSIKQWQMEAKNIRRPIILGLCSLSPNNYIESLQLNLKTIRQQNESYLRAKDKEIKQKIKNKHKKIKSQPIVEQQAKINEAVSRTHLQSRTLFKYDHLLEERLIRKSINISRCCPLARNRKQNSSLAENNLLRINEANQRQEYINIDARQSSEIDKLGTFLAREDRVESLNQLPKEKLKKFQYQKIFINQLNEYKNIHIVDRNTILQQLAVLKHKKSVSIDEKDYKTIKKTQIFPHFSHRNQNQSQVLGSINPRPKHYDKRFIKQNLFKRSAREKQIYKHKQRKSTILGLMKSSQQEIEKIILQDGKSYPKTCQRKRVVFSNKNICKEMLTLYDQGSLLTRKGQL